MNALDWLDHHDLRRWRVCARRFWMHRRHGGDPEGPGAAPDALADASVVDGPSAAAALRASYPGARLIDAPATPADWERAVQQTLAALAQPLRPGETAVLLGACLASEDGVRVRIDVLERRDSGLRLFRLRLATAGDEADVDAVALAVHVAARGGARLAGAGLLLVDTEFVYPGLGCYAGLFREVDLGPTLGSRPVGEWIAAMRAVERLPAPPVLPGAPCSLEGGCRFVVRCLAADEVPAAGDPHASLEIVGRELADELRHEGHVDLHDVPLARLADARHRRAARAVQQGAPVREPALGRLMRAQAWPRHFLRFDTIGFAVPVWPGTQPYQVLPFQWSCAIEAAPGRLAQRGFIADAARDPRRDFAESLLQALGRDGPVFAYNAGFERNRLRELARRFEDLTEPLAQVQARIVDLFQIARANYYHPAMRGSWSLRSMCRAIAPELGECRFDCAAAATPQQAFARTLQPGAPADALREALRAHGQRRTAMLRRMVEVFEG